MKFLGAIFLVVVLAGFAYGADDETKIIRMNGQSYQIWTDKNGIRRIDPVFLVEKSKIKNDNNQTVTAKVASNEMVKEVEEAAEKVEDADPAKTVVEEMDYAACRESLAAAEAMASVYNVIFDYPKGQKFTVLMAVDKKTVQLKCEYGTRVTTTWEN